MSTQEMTTMIDNPGATVFNSPIGSSFKFEAVKIVGICVAFVPVMFVLTSASLGFLDPAYDWVRNTISELIWGQHGWILAVEFCLFGIVLVALAWRLKTNFAIGLKSKVGLVLLALIGVAFLVIAVFPTRAPGAPESLAGFIHLNTVRVMTVLLPASCLLIGADIRNDPETRIIRVQSLAAGVMGILLIVPGAIATLTDASWLGAIERVILINGLLWIEVMTISVTFPGIIRQLDRRFGSGFIAKVDVQGLPLPKVGKRSLIMKKSLIMAILLVVILPVISLGCSANQGPKTTIKYEFSSFTNVQLIGPFEVEVTPTPVYSVMVTAPESEFKRIKVEQSGSTLKIEVDWGGIFWNWGTYPRPQVKISLPVLTILDISGACKASIIGFSSDKDFKLVASGASTADVDLEVYDTSMSVTGASRITGNLKAHDARLNISGASTANLSGSGNRLNLQASGASRADLSLLTAVDVRVDLSGASKAHVLPSVNLDVFLSGASRLDYGGTAALGTVDVSGGSKINHV